MTDGPHQSPTRRGPRRPAGALPKGPTAPGQDGRRQLGPGRTHSAGADPAGRQVRDTSNGRWVSVPDESVVEPAAPAAPPSRRPSGTGQPATPAAATGGFGSAGGNPQAQGHAEAPPPPPDHAPG